jgi:hypothetical protein
MLHELQDLDERALAAMQAMVGLPDHVRIERAVAHVKVFEKEGGKLISEAWGQNLKTTAGIDFLFAQGYSAAPGANGLNYVANSTDTTLSETAASTSMNDEIVAYGLQRAHGTYAHTAGQSTCTVTYQFTVAGYSGVITVGKCCLYSAAVGGAVTHILLLTTPQPLVNGNVFQVQFTITIS